MQDNSQLEKRSLVRYLCDDSFSSCLLYSQGTSTNLQAINFNRGGICLFGSERLPLQKEITLSFNYQKKNNLEEFIEIIKIPCFVLHRQETDIGNHYGIQFNVDAISPELLEKLLIIETCLISGEDGGDRYGLFS